MKRFLYDQLVTWKSQDTRKPLLLQGARQVGKTYLLKEFGRKEYSDCAYFNFEETPDLNTLFESSLDPNLLIESLSAYLGRKIVPEKTLIFLDEIQASPRAITSLKYLCEKAPTYHVVAAGSLLGVSVGKPSSFPVGKVNFIMMFPMSFFEFLSAMDEEILLQQLVEKRTCMPVPEAIHRKLLRLYKYYLYLGGMPEVIQHYTINTDIKAARQIQKDILKAYERDFSKYSSPREAIMISEIWNSIPTQLARENKKFRYSEVKKGGRASRFESSIEWLRKAGLIYISHNLKIPKLPLRGYADLSKFKVFMLDTGLLGAMLDVHSRIILSSDLIFSQYNGAFIENYVAAELVHKGIEHLFYWVSKTEAEVDFIIGYEENIFPLEVKSGLSRKTKSLRVYSQKYHPDTVYRISPRNFTKDNDLVNIPLYAVSLLPV